MRKSDAIALTLCILGILLGALWFADRARSCEARLSSIGEQHIVVDLSEGEGEPNTTRYWRDQEHNELFHNEAR